MNRRRMLGMLAGAALSPLLGSESEAKKRKTERHHQIESAHEGSIESDKTNAAERIVSNLRSQKRAYDFAARAYFGGIHDEHAMRAQLVQESRMFEPSPETFAMLDNKFRSDLAILNEATETNGVLIDGDTQTLYVARKKGDGLSFLKGYRISSSREPWSNVAESRGSPLGLHHIASARVGLLGEVLSPKERAGNAYPFLRIKEQGHLVERPFIEKFGHHTDTAAEIITGAFMLVGPETPPTRGIFIHGTNYPELLGTRASGGCIRLSSVDVYDIAQYLHAGAHGTPVMLATSKKDEPVAVARPKRRNLFDDIP